jgi:CMP-N-acetylneuraminic acid synthetase
MKKNKQISVLAVITARGGSKAVPGKNLYPLGGKPLIEWTIDAALNAKCITRTIVSTDAQDIIDIAKNSGAEVPFVRPSNLASDTAGSVEVMEHALAECPGFDYFVMLQPTSPLRTAFDIDSAFEKMLTEDAKACVSVTEVEKSPWLMYQINEQQRLDRLLPPNDAGIRRQDLPKIYILNGAIYIGEIHEFKTSRQLVPDTAIGHVLPREKSIDIDTIEDFRRAEELLTKINFSKKIQ